MFHMCQKSTKPAGFIPRGETADPATMAAVDALIRKIGDDRASKELGVDRLTVLRLALGLRLQRHSLAQVRLALKAQQAAPA